MRRDSNFGRALYNEMFKVADDKHLDEALIEREDAEDDDTAYWEWRNRHAFDEGEE